MPFGRISSTFAPDSGIGYINMFLTLPKLHRRFMVSMALMLASGMGGFTMAGVIAVSVAGSDRPTYFRGPVPVIVSVSNISLDPVKILLPYPNPNNLSLRALGDTAVRQKTVERKRSERTVPIELAAGETRVLNYYLNRYLEFLGPGQANVCPKLILPGTRGKEFIRGRRQCLHHIS